jgi:hypothetical protein
MNRCGPDFVAEHDRRVAPANANDTPGRGSAIEEVDADLAI